METAIGEYVVCMCGKELNVLFGACAHINCPRCGMLLKIGSCDA